ncbi:MAG: Rrf2 family transcriptional regulator [Proteobacteria bacterium]|nr:Rrf2 family transcriptional regulator [Pseudomonadota bacterium]
MQLTRFTDYSLRVLLFVGRKPGRVSTIAEIAAFYRISREHLRKVAHRMAKLGYLDSTRGRGGGLTLGCDPDRIRVGDLVLELEKDLSIVDCRALQCRLRPGCSLKNSLDRAGRAFIATLNEVTLADLLSDKAMKRQFRGVEIEVRNCG